MRNRYILILICFLTITRAYATHEMAGEITYRPVVTSGTCFDYEITVTTYTDMRSSADRCSMMVSFGDGTSFPADRSNLPWESDSNLCISGSLSCTRNQGCGIALGPAFPNVKKNVYHTWHTYAGPGSYLITIKDPNHVVNICNIVNSVNVQFALQSMLVIDSVYGCISSPAFSDLPVDNACVGFYYYHAVHATDANGDSLSYSVGPLLDTTNLPLVSYSAPPVTTGGSFGMDSLTGLISWLNPPLICNYSFSVRVNKWRKIGGVAHLIGMVNRNFFVIVSTGCTGNTGLNDEKTSRVRVYPNPSSGEITFETRQSGGVGIPETLSFYDLSGRFISEIYQENNGKTVLPAEYLSPGMYFYRLTSRDRKTEQGSFVIVPR